MPQFADVILPLPLQGAFTYALPPEMAKETQVGSRVIVPFGNRKFYTAIVVRLHDETPPYPTKPVSELLDTKPIILPEQLRLWKWLADYYFCTLGDVFKAALPSGLKLESESTILLNENWEAESTLSPNEEKIWRALGIKAEQTLLSLQKETGIRNILPAVKSLLEKGVVRMKEEIRRTYKPKTVTSVGKRLCWPVFLGSRLPSKSKDCCKKRTARTPSCANFARKAFSKPLPSLSKEHKLRGNKMREKGLPRL